MKHFIKIKDIPLKDLRKISKEDIPYVIDDSPLKQNRFSPGMHVPIRPFNEEDIVDVYIVFAYEYIYYHL